LRLVQATFASRQPLHSAQAPALAEKMPIVEAWESLKRAATVAAAVFSMSAVGMDFLKPDAFADFFCSSRCDH
jgi:hypothetical protein